MAYQNPYISLGLPVDSWAPADTESIRRKRKEMLAELEAAGSGFLQTHTETLGKQDLITLFDQLEDPVTRTWHAQVARQASLYTFLTDARLDYFYEGDVSLLPSYDPEFLAWIAPHFAKSYNSRLAHAFRQHDSDELGVLCSHPLPLPSEHLANAYKDTYQQVHELREGIQREIEALDAGKQPDGNLANLLDEFLINALNYLPEWFQGIRDAIAESLEQLALTLTRRFQRTRLSLLVLRQALKLEISSGTRSSLEEFQQQLYSIHPEEEWKSWLTDQEGKGVNPWVVALGVGAAGFALWLLSRWRG